MIKIYENFEYDLNESFSNKISNNKNEEDQYIELDNPKDIKESDFRKEELIDDLISKVDNFILIINLILNHILI